MKTLTSVPVVVSAIAILLGSCSSGTTQSVDGSSVESSMTESVTPDSDALQPSIDSGTQDLNDQTEMQYQLDQSSEPPDWTVTRILNRSPTSESQVHTQQTPIDTKDGYVYVVGIEPGPNGDGDGIRQTTTIKQGRAVGSNEWEWNSATISDNTIYDSWHSPPSVGVDRSNYIHVAYNMHNSPWQYVVSSDPHSLKYFEFKGQAVSEAQYAELEFENKASFDSLGTAALAGSQITYPAFFRNQKDQLFLTYRAAAKPAREFWQRTMSGIMSSYDEQRAQWKAIGSEVQLKEDDVIEIPGSYRNINALAAETGWTVYHPKLAFTKTGEMHVMLFWRPGVGGAHITRPCHVVTNDQQNFYTLGGEYLELPLTSSDCGNMGYGNDELFYTLADLKVDLLGQPHALLSPVDKPRELIHYNSKEERWIREPSPSDASHFFFDVNGRQWVAADGLKLLYRDSPDQPWVIHYDEDHNDCFAKIVWNENQTKAYIHTQACDSSSATVYELALGSG